MNTNSKRLSIYVVLMLIGTAIAVTLRSIACIGNLNNDTGYFDDGSLTAISDPLIWVTVILSLTYIFVASRIKLKASFSTPSTYIPTGLLGVSTLFLGVRVLSEAIIFKSTYKPTSQNSPTAPIFEISIVVFIFAILSVGYYFLNTYCTESKTEKRALFAMAAIAFLGSYVMLIYFDQSLPINNSGKIVNQMAYLFSAIFFLYEARISIGREMWRAYTAFGLAATALCAYSSIPALITYYVNGTLIFSSRTGAFASIEEYMLTFALFIFILSRLLLTLTLKEEKENELIKAMTEFANARNEAVEDSFTRFQEDFAAKQLSIFELYGGGDLIEEEAQVEVQEENKEEEEPKTLTISDDVIYEAIFGKMPEKEDSESEQETPTEPEVKEEEVNPEEIAQKLLSTIEEAEKENKKD